MKPNVNAPMMCDTSFDLGVGLSFREPLATELIDSGADVDFYELIGDTLFDRETLEFTLEVTGGRPTVCHFLGTSLATDAPLDPAYLDGVARVMNATGALWLSDHLAITSVPGLDLGHLSPPVFNNRTVDLVADKIKTIQDSVGKPFLVENISYLFALPGAELCEANLLERVCIAADCGLLLDLNNLYVNSINHHYDPFSFIAELPLERASQVHIAGSATMDGVMIDTHADPVPEAVFDLLAAVRHGGGAGSVVLERDRNFPPLADLLAEMERARGIWRAQGSAASNFYDG